MRNWQRSIIAALTMVAVFTLLGGVVLAHHGRAGLTAEDRAVLAPRFERLSRDAGSLAALSLDLVNELKTA